MYLKVKMLSQACGPEWCCPPGKEVTVPEAQARDLVRSKYAEAVGWSLTDEGPVAPRPVASDSRAAEPSVASPSTPEAKEVTSDATTHGSSEPADAEVAVPESPPEPVRSQPPASPVVKKGPGRPKGSGKPARGGRG